MRIRKFIGLLTIVASGACAGGEPGESTQDDTAGAPLHYHCPVTGEDPEGPDVWLELHGADASLAHDSTFAATSSGALDATYKPTQRVNMVRFRGFDGWTPGGTTTLYVNKALQTEGGDGDIFLDTVTSKFTETVYACHAFDDGGSTCAWSGSAGELVTFAFDGEPGNEVSVAPASSADGVSASALSRSTAITATKASGSLSASHWATAATADGTRYYSFTVTPSSGCSIALDAVRIGLSASGTGPKKVDIATSADGFATHTTSVASTGTPTIPLSAVNAGAIEIRVYGYQASSTAGTLRLRDTVTLTGSIQ